MNETSLLKNVTNRTRVRGPTEAHWAERSIFLQPTRAQLPWAARAVNNFFPLCTLLAGTGANGSELVEIRPDPLQTR